MLPDPLPDPVFARIGELAAASFGWRLFTAMRYLPEQDAVERVYSSDPLAYPAGGRKSKRDTPWSRQVLFEGRAFFGADAAALREHFEDADKIIALGFGAIINVPVKRGAQVIGTLNFTREAGGYRPADVAAALALAPLAAAALAARPDERGPAGKAFA